MDITKETIEKAYKKLKSSVYFDKTQLVLRNKLVEFEQEHQKEGVDEYLCKAIFKSLGDEDKFKILVDNICSEISVTSLPKKIADVNSNIIINSVSKEVEIKELQHYIDMPVEGHILGVLWIMLIGYRIDANIYEHSYGNRIRKKLVSEFSNEYTYSPYLFEPYFEQYESWRDKAMSEAQKHMSERQDVVIITMDFRRYYYSLDVDDTVMERILECAELDEQGEQYANICTLLNCFVKQVISSYAALFDDAFEKRKILPIGFLPSNIIGNWCLNRFDKAVVDGWNPAYYGRYVDDILIVDKIERNSSIYKKAKNNELTRNDVINFFLTSCSKWNGFDSDKCKNSTLYAIIQRNERLSNAHPQGENVYTVNPKYNPCENNKSEISVHNDKVKIFYFKWDESDALITCFKSNISKNKSEFRHLPEDEAVFQKDDYSDIYSLKNSDTVNKFRGVDAITLDKYELSKFLGKYLRIGGMIRDKSESRFEKDILKIFNSRAIIENYSAWEKIIEILIINERFKALEAFCEKVHEAISLLTFSDEINGITCKTVKKSLYIQLHASLCRNLALVWKQSRKDAQNSIYSKFLAAETGGYADQLIEGYCKTRMIDKSVMPISYEMLLTENLSVSSDVNFTRFGECLFLVKSEWDSSYKYYPYVIGMYDISLISCLESMNLDDGDIPYDDLSEVYEREAERYIKINYQVADYQSHEAYGLISAKEILPDKSNDTGRYLISVGEGIKSEFRIAIANVKLNPTNFEKIIKDCPNRTYSRYKDLSELINSAIDQKADFLIMPESYVPFEWLPTIARTCAKNKLALITGVEHIKFKHINRGNGKAKERVYNFTAVILPYEEDSYKCAHISFHLKKHYAPSEIEKIEGYRLCPVEGNNYELYKWNDCYFPVYCCYELTSIVDRSIFQSYADMIVAVEWNKDVKYYSNILESLSRDIHCYCIQVNSSEYGDSRITKPSKSEEKDLIRTKGGVNSIILLDDINISELRDFQLKEYSLQQKDGHLKTTPPNFDKNIVLKKVRNIPVF